MACVITWEAKGVLFTHSGEVTTQEVMAMNDIIYGDVRFDSITYQIADYTDVTRNLITGPEAKVVGSLDKASAQWNTKKMKLAVVTNDMQFIPIVNLYFQQLEGTGWEGKIFEDLASAYSWVKLE